MTECRRCGGRAADSFLCGICTRTLGETLTALPWWLHRLTEAALGQVRMSDNGGRKSARRGGLDGDAALASCIEPLPPNRDDDLERARAERERHALRVALAAGGVNARASELLAEIADVLGFWCRVLCEERGLVYEPPSIRNRPVALGQDHAEWLRAHLPSIAASESAEDIYGDIESRLEDIVAAVNRPIRWWELGECPSLVKGEDCGSALRAEAHTEEVQCRRCGTRHNVHRLLLARKHDREARPMTARELLRYNRTLPEEFQTPQRTLQHWLATGRLCACGFDGADPLYDWVDVRLLMVRRPQRAVTGAAAHRRGS